MHYIGAKASGNEQQAVSTEFYGEMFVDTRVADNCKSLTKRKNSTRMPSNRWKAPHVMCKRRLDSSWKPRTNTPIAWISAGKEHRELPSANFWLVEGRRPLLNQCREILLQLEPAAQHHHLVVARRISRQAASDNQRLWANGLIHLVHQHSGSQLNRARDSGSRHNRRLLDNPRRREEVQHLRKLHQQHQHSAKLPPLVPSLVHSEPLPLASPHSSQHRAVLLVRLHSLERNLIHLGLRAMSMAHLVHLQPLQMRVTQLQPIPLQALTPIKIKVKTTPHQTHLAPIILTKASPAASRILLDRILRVQALLGRPRSPIPLARPARQKTSNRTTRLRKTHRLKQTVHSARLRPTHLDLLPRSNGTPLVVMDHSLHNRLFQQGV